MTYISRRTRIILSRWTDECDADYILRAVRKRSDGRFKRHSSCDDLRAWVNDYCIKHEHLVDLMSDGEFSERPPFRLYGRFIPVPILFKLTQSLQNNDGVNSGKKAEKDNQGIVGKSASDKCTCIDSSDWNVNESPNVERRASSSRFEWEKNHLEKSLYDSNNLLNRALRTLERIDNIVDLAKEESESERNEEIQHAFDEAQVVCECNPFGERKNSNVSDSIYSSQSYVKKLQNSTKRNELLRKLSGVKEKLEKIKKCRQMIKRQIRMTQGRDTKCESPNQLTELFSFQGQSHAKKPEKKLEELISEKERLLSKTCDALNSLNSLKKVSRLNLPQRRSSKMSRNGDASRSGPRESGSCACGCNCSRASSEFDKYNSDSPSGESYCNECANNYRQMDPCDTFRDFPRDSSLATPPRTSYSRKSRSSDTVRGDDECFTPLRCSKELQRNSLQDQRNSKDPCIPQSRDLKSRQSTSRQQKFMKGTKTQNTPREIKKEDKEAKRQSKVNFPEENESPCRKKYYQDDLSAYEKTVTSQQQAVIQKALKKIELRRSQLFNTQETQKRPMSSPTTRGERNSISLERRSQEGCERRVKSETTMQKIEKTLRNYEKRLRNYDALEYKVEEIRQKISEANRMKREWARQRDERQREMDAEREKSCKEITRLSSENRMLKKYMQQLIAKFETQCKKIQRLKTVAQKNWELECETEVLKKELMKYQDTLENQRKCITKWEKVVTLQKTEIENLMNHIRRLEMQANNYSEECPSPERKNAQRSRSYSPEMTIPKKLTNRPKTRDMAYKSSSEEECDHYYCHEYKQPENRKRSQQLIYNGDCYSPPPGRRTNW